MILLALIAPVLIVFAFVWLLDRRDKRQDQNLERHRQQQDRLIQRIQAPDVAVATQAKVDLDGVPQVQYVPPDDDTAWQANLIDDGRGVEASTDWRTFLDEVAQQ